MKVVKIGVFIATGVVVALLARHSEQVGVDLPNRIPEAAPYVTEEAAAFPPPYEEYWKTQNNPGQCQTCHSKIFDEWNGSMMSNSWRDPVWRGAFLLLSRATSTNGNCDLPAPPDGTEKAKRNPFAKDGECASTFDIGTEHVTLSRPGSLLDAFCSRCHMPTNYTDNFHLKDITKDANGIEYAPADTNFNPTGDNHTGIAFATVDEQFRNTESGKTGIFCAVCHTMGATRDTPYHNYERGGTEYVPAVGTEGRAELLGDKAESTTVADPTKRNLGYSIGAGAYRMSPHAIVFPERFGPLTATEKNAEDTNTSTVFDEKIPFQMDDSSKHKGFHSPMYVRAEMCGTCHDVTNALPIKNPLGKWAGGFPIERTYTEWANSRYADRPGNKNFDPKFKRDCQSCHMQQEYGQPGTAQTLYDQTGHPLPIPMEPVANDGKPRPFFSHHFVGGNALVPRLLGKDVDNSGNVSPYPEISAYSYSSADHKSPYSRAVWTHLERKGAYTQQARMAWDRLRHVVSLDAAGPSSADAGSKAAFTVTVANTGSGHNFPTGFPEGRVGWIAVHAYDLSTGKELQIHDSQWNRDSLGFGNLTTEEIEDPNFPKCKWEMPIGSPDPYAVQFKAVATLGDGCPTLDLPYATPVNMKVNADGFPIDKDGRVIEARNNPKGLPIFEDKDGDGDLFDDAFLTDTRLRPMPHPDATRKVDRYSVVIPPGTKGPVVVSTGLYYQSVEAIVGQKFLGNMTDTNNNLIIEPCVLGGRCDGRKPRNEPAVVEGSPPVPMSIKALVININGAQGDTSAPRVGVYPKPGANRAFLDTVPKVFFSRPVTGVNTTTFTLTDSTGATVPAWVDPIGDGVWGLFANSILLKPGATYTAHLAAGICDAAVATNCTTNGAEWSFTVADDADGGDGDTGLPIGWSGANGPQPPLPGSPESKAITPGPAGPVKTAGAAPTAPAPAAPATTPATGTAPTKSASAAPAGAPATAATLGAAAR
ncbi:MAG TPA: Ig-like domain-containing protein [Kofleriaceae bacterium]|nr:Ig-like domain-containing protein [Kofleriaceae bacterium]